MRDIPNGTGIMIDRLEERQKDEYLEKLKVLVTTYALLEARELANAEE